MESMKTINPIINSLFQFDYFVIDQWDQWNYEWRFLIPFAMDSKLSMNGIDGNIKVFLLLVLYILQMKAIPVF